MSETKTPMVGIQDTVVHLGRRRAWNRGLSPGAIKEYEVVLAGRVKQLVQQLGAQPRNVTLDTWLSYFS